MGAPVGGAGYSANVDLEAVKIGASRDGGPYLAYRRVLDRLAQRFTGRSPRGRLLDVGCSYGAFLELASEVGWKTFGVEPSRAASEYAARERGLEIFRGTLEDAALPEESFAVVTVWDVVERLDRPLDAVRAIYRLLAPGGLLVLSTAEKRSRGNRFAAIAYRATLGHWKGPLESIYERDQRFFFDRTTLREALMRGGFDEVELDRLEASSELDRTPRLLAYARKADSG